MEKAKINGWQLFCLMVLFELGTALVVGVGIDAKKDAWLAILLGLAIGLILFLVYSSLFHLFPSLPLTSYVQKILGKYIGWPIGLLYTLYFIYSSARVLRDDTYLLSASVYHQTPTFVIGFLIIATAAYIIHKGIEVSVRIGEIFFIVVVVLIFLGNILVCFSGIIDVQRLRPVLEYGWTPVVTTAFQSTVIFPFSEMISVTMLFPYLNKPQQAIITGWSAMIVSGIILASTVALDILVLGINITSRSTFPMLTALSKVNIADFIQHVDSIIILNLIITSLFKIVVYYYISVIGIVDLFKLETHQKLVVPIGIVIFFSAMTISSNIVEHIEEGIGKAMYFRSIPMAIGIPLFLLIVALVRKRFGFHR